MFVCTYIIIQTQSILLIGSSVYEDSSFIIQQQVSMSVDFAINVSKDPILSFEDGLLSAQCEWRSGERCGPDWSVGLEVNVIAKEREKK